MYDCDEIVSYMSNVVPLLPGDIIATGTCTGVGMSRGVFLAPGDEIDAEVEGIGVLHNPVITEAEAGFPLA
jgi:2-keto-4-pentenoate hydratase/2-oxohepta-3-ene-1,7-dioic acid hydratase in catechol pathway